MISYFYKYSIRLFKSKKIYIFTTFRNGLLKKSVIVYNFKLYYLKCGLNAQ